MRKENVVFIAATGQNVGKTTLCLGLIAALKKRYSSVGFIKPMGQQHVSVQGNIKVDKDVVLFKEYFGLPADWSDMSPVIIPAGFTREFLDQKVTEKEMEEKILRAFQKIYTQNEYTVVEGTGHVGVGSIVNMNNAKIASQLGLDMVIIAPGGLGSSHDELSLNIAMCRHYGVRIRGVILNRVLEDKRDMLMDYFPKTLRKWGIPLVGAVPYNEFLSNRTMRDFENLFNSQMISGEKQRYRHFPSIRLVAGSLEAYREEMHSNELIITPASREDIILASLDKGCAFILTGRHPPKPDLIETLRKADIPVLYAPLCSYDAMKMITSYTAKIRREDTPKVEAAIELIESHVDLDLL